MHFRQDLVSFAHDRLLCHRCLAQSPSNTNLDNTTQALVMPPGTTASGGSGGPATRAQTSSQFDEGSVKSEGVGKVAGGKRGAPASQSSQPKKAPKLVEKNVVVESESDVPGSKMISHSVGVEEAPAFSQ